MDYTVLCLLLVTLCRQTLPNPCNTQRHTNGATHRWGNTDLQLCAPKLQCPKHPLFINKPKNVTLQSPENTSNIFETRVKQELQIRIISGPTMRKKREINATSCCQLTKNTPKPISQYHKTCPRAKPKHSHGFKTGRRAGGRAGGRRAGGRRGCRRQAGGQDLETI